MKKEKDISEEKKGLTAFQKIMVFFAVVIGLPTITMIWFGIETSDTYHIFTKKRIAEMENRFGIIVNDDITLKKYNANLWMEKVYNLKADVKDYRSFMQNNIKGEILSFEEYEKNELESFVSAVYNYKFISNGYEEKCSVTFTENENGTYDASFITH